MSYAVKNDGSGWRMVSDQAECRADETWQEDQPISLPPSPRFEFIAAAQRQLDKLAQAWGYDSVFSACTYADEPSVPQFQAEGQALRRYRSEFWAAAYSLQPTQEDTIETLLARLPPPPARPT